MKHIVLQKQLSDTFARFKDNPALQKDDKIITFQELENQVLQVSQYLMEKDTGKGTAVGILLEDRVDLVIGILGILFSGAIFVPMETTLPLERLNLMITFTGINRIICDTKSRKRLKEIVDEKKQELSFNTLEDIFVPKKKGFKNTGIKKPNFKPEDMVYVYFTSGTTGIPKGILGKNSGLLHFINWEIDTFGVDETHRFSQFTNPGFDVFLRDIFVPLCSGGTICIPEEPTLLFDSNRVALWIDQYQVNMIHIVPSLFRVFNTPALNPNQFNSLKGILFAGEKIIPSELKNWYHIFDERIQLVNLYGPTETTLAKMYYLVRQKDTGRELMPVGTHIKGSRTIILDEELKPCEKLVTGDIYIRTPYRTAGYLNDPELTAKKFVQNPFSNSPGDFLYSTGDLGRMLPDGNIELLGRKDRQVKLRGIRLELDEVENVFLKHSIVKEAVVIKVEIPGKNEYLSSCITLNPCAEIQGKEESLIKQIKEYLMQRFPDYMVPADISVIEQMPRTPNGKINYEEVKKIIAEASYEIIPASNELEQRLMEIWIDKLGVEKIGVKNTFLELGGNSLNAVKLISQVHKEFGIRIPFEEIFQEFTIEKQARIVEQSGSNEYQVIRAIEKREYYDMSPAQKRVWVQSQVKERSLAFHILNAQVLEGKLDTEAFSQAIITLVQRHESLRTCFISLDGEPKQAILPYGEIGIVFTHTNLSSDGPVEARIRQEMQLEADTPFNLSTGPLLRAKLIQFNNERYVFLLNIHHIVGDFLSNDIIAGEMMTLYNAFVKQLDFPLKPLRIHYKDYTAWQDQQLRDTHRTRLKEYWTTQLKDIPVPLELPVDRERASHQTHRGDALVHRFDREWVDKLRSLSTHQGMTLFMTLFAGMNLLIFRYTGQQDIVLGTPIAGRDHPELENQVGIYLNTLALRTRFLSDHTFRELLEKSKRVVIEAFKHKIYPFDQLVEELGAKRDVRRHPIFDVLVEMLTFRQQQEPERSIPLRIKPFGSSQKRSKFDLAFLFIERNGSLDLNAEYNTDFFDRTTIQRMVRHFITLLQSATEEPSQNLGSIPILEEHEKTEILENWNQTGAEYPAHTLYPLFHAKVEQNPEKLALTTRTNQMTYGELRRQAHIVAIGLLQQDGCQKNQLKGLLLERTEMMIKGILGVLETGGIYLPLDPEYPEERIALLLRDSACQTVITEDILKERITREYNGEVMELPLAGRTPYKGDSLQARGKMIVAPEDPAYVIYTSGTTGIPKGCVVTHRNLVRLFFNSRNPFDFNETDTWIQMHSFCFDFSVWEMYGALLMGGNLILPTAQESRDISLILDMIRQHKVTLLNQTPPSFYNLIREERERTNHDLHTRLRYIILGGGAFEPVTLKEWIQWYPLEELPIINMFGITETTVHVTVHRVLRSEVESPKIYGSIGTPLPETRVYILDPQMNVVPIGVTGELFVGGSGVSRGYLNRTPLTKERFIPDLLKKGEIMYRTGDLGQWQENGEIQYVRRNDLQVKIRGYRIELGEIRGNLMKHSGVRDVALVPRNNHEGDAELCAYLVLHPHTQLQEIRDYLAKQLPSHMLPSFLVILEEIPLTLNGKVDIKQLPDPLTQTITNIYEAPRNKIEEKLADIWSQVLGRDKDKISIHDNFFEIGGHSLKATKLISRIHQELGVRLPFIDIFENPSIKELSQQIKGFHQEKYDSIEPSEKKEYYSLSSAQKRLFILHQMEPKSIGYNMPEVFELGQEPDTEKIERVLSQLIQQHEALRTAFFIHSGEPVQRINPGITFRAYQKAVQTLEHDTHGKEAVNDLMSEFIKPFHLGEPSLLRVGILGVDQKRYFLVTDMHHIVSDGVSHHILLKDFITLYQGDSLARLRLQYKDYSEWQTRSIAKGELQSQADFWKKEFLGDMPVLELPLDFNRPPVQSFEGGGIGFAVSKKSCEALRQLARTEGVTLFMILFALYQVLLSRLSLQQEVVVGTPIAGRRHKDLEPIIGVFINTLPLRAYPSGEKRFLEFLREIKQMALACFENQEYPFENLVEELHLNRDISRNPLFDAFFNFETYEKTEKTEEKIKSREHPQWIAQPFGFDVGLTKFDITLYAREKPEELEFTLAYATRLFRKETIIRYVGYFRKILESAGNDPDQSLGQIDILSTEERDTLLTYFNNTDTEYPGGKTLHQMVAEQTKKTPLIVALAGASDNHNLTYNSIREGADKVASILKDLGINFSSIVAIAVKRRVEMMMGLLGILTAGAAYLPLDPGFPSFRIDYILVNTAIEVIVTQEDSSPGDRLDLQNIKRVNLITGDFKRSMTLMGREKPKTQQHDNQGKEKSKKTKIAYVIYTSGSTGKPKGVVVSHQNVVNFINAMARVIDFKPGKHVLALTTISFDIFFLEFLLPVSTGSTVILADENHQADPDLLEKLVRKHRIQILQVTPSRLQSMLNFNSKLTCLKNLNYLMVGGEVFPYTLFEKVKAVYNGRIYNMYGPTETTIWSTYRELTTQGIDKLTIGGPISNTQVYVLDRNLNLQPLGVPGELVIGGDGVGTGYLNDPEQTRERFLNNPFRPGGKLYRTGDQCRWLPDGELEFLGRQDHQVKVRGFRVETGEIEYHLMTHKSIKEALVIVREDKKGEHYLCSYLVKKKEQSGISSGMEIRNHLSERLPEYMIPVNFIYIDTIPLTPNGKIDRKALPLLETPIRGDGNMGPRDEDEARLVGIWSKVLGIHRHRIRIDENFFTIGGHSLRAITMVSLIHKAFQVKVPMLEVFRRPRIIDLIGYIKEAPRTGFESIKPTEKKDYYTLSSAQKRLYILQQMELGNTVYNMPEFYELGQEMDGSQIGVTFHELVKRHESLRTYFNQKEGEPVARVHVLGEFEFERCVLKPNEKGLVGMKEIKNQMNAFIRPFDLTKAPLIRAGLIYIRGQAAFLMVDSHHIVSDGISQGILEREFRHLYSEQELPGLKIQYKDYTEWQKGKIQDRSLRQQEEYWIGEFSDEIPQLNIPSDFPRPLVQSFSGASLSFQIEKEMITLLKNLAQEEGTTTFMLMLAIANIFFSLICNQEDVVIGTPVAGRRHADLEGILGVFVNSLALRNRPYGGKKIREFLGEVRESTIKAFENQEYPFEELVEKVPVVRDVSRNPIFDVMLVYRSQDNSISNKQEKGAISMAVGLGKFGFDKNESKFDMTLQVVERPGKIDLLLEYNTRLFYSDRIHRFITYFRRVIEGVITQPDRLISGIEIVEKEEKNRLLQEFNSTDADYPGDKTIHQQVEYRVEQYPHQIAVIQEDKQITYKKMDKKSTELSGLLVEKGIHPDSIVAIIVEPTLDMMVGIFGVLKAGGAYLPINPTYPLERISYMLRDCAYKACLVQKKFSNMLRIPKDNIIHLPYEKQQREKSKKIENQANPGSIAYIIYTSGTTGKPKGVMIEHRNVMRLLINDRSLFFFSPQDAWTLFHSYCFDFSVWEMYGALFYGGRLVQVSRDMALDPKAFADCLVREKVTVLNQTPSSFYHLSECILENNYHDLHIRYVIFGGEALSPGRLGEWKKRYPWIKLINMFGITETTVHVTYKEISEEEIRNNTSNIGKPIPTLRCYVLNRSLNLTPIGVPGELCVAGLGLGRGYLNNPELYEDKFVENPYKPGEKMYRSGDQVKINENGDMTYMGRIDTQIKIRGYRIELGEIESSLQSLPFIQDAVVLDADRIYEDGKREKYLCAFIVCKPYSNTLENEFDVQDLKNNLSKKMPEYMIPSFFIPIKEVPLTPNGKLNRNALLQMGTRLASFVEYIAPGNSLEKKVAAVWREVLGMGRVGIHDNFFDIGGNSFNIIQLSNKLRKVLGNEISVMSLFRNPSIRTFLDSRDKGKRDQEQAQKEAGIKRAEDSLEEAMELFKDN